MNYETLTGWKLVTENSQVNGGERFTNKIWKQHG
jgi:hypothetical protein